MGNRLTQIINTAIHFVFFEISHTAAGLDFCDEILIPAIIFSNAKGPYLLCYLSSIFIVRQLISGYTQWDIVRKVFSYD